MVYGHEFSDDIPEDCEGKRALLRFDSSAAGHTILTEAMRRQPTEDVIFLARVIKDLPGATDIPSLQVAVDMCKACDQRRRCSIGMVLPRLLPDEINEP